MKNKLLITTAIASTFAFAGASFAETKVVGNLETTFNAASSDTAINSGRSIDAETNIGLEGSKSLGNGLTAKYGFMLENGNSDTEFLTVGTDTVNFAIGTDFGNNLSMTAVPHVGDQAGTVAGVLTALSGTNIPVANVHNASHVALNINGMGGTITARYAPDLSNTRGGASTILGDIGESGTEFMYSGNLGVDGLRLIIGRGEVDAAIATGTDSGKHDKISAAYNFGKVSIGAEKQKSETAATAATQIDRDTDKVGISFAASDAISIGLNYQETEAKEGGVDSGVDEKVTMLSIGYNLGGLGIQFQYADISDLGNERGVDAETFQIRTIQSF
jgi:hypothetical protein